MKRPYRESIALMKERGDLHGLCGCLADYHSVACQQLALDTIRSMGQPAIPVLVGVLPDVNAATALAYCGDHALYAVLRLSGAAEATEDDQRHAMVALFLFAMLRADARAFFEVERLESEGISREVRKLAHAAVRRVGRPLRDQLSKLSTMVDQLGTDDPRKLYRTAMQLADIGPRILTTLIFKASDRKLSGGIAMVLRTVGSPIVQPTIDAFNAGAPGLTWPLISLGADFPQALAAVQQAAHSHPDEGVRAEAVEALERERIFHSAHGQ